MCSLLKAKSTSKLTRQQDTRGAGSLSPCTTQAQDLSQRFPEGLVAISADSFKFLALLQHSFGPWAPPVPVPADVGAARAQLQQHWPEGFRPSLSPSTQQCQAVLLQSCSPSRAAQAENPACVRTGGMLTRAEVAPCPASCALLPPPQVQSCLQAPAHLR